MIKRGVIGCDNEITDTDSLREEESGISDITDKRFTAFHQQRNFHEEQMQQQQGFSKKSPCCGINVRLSVPNAVKRRFPSDGI